MYFVIPDSKGWDQGSSGKWGIFCENVQPIHGLEKDEKRIFQTENKVGVRYWIMWLKDGLWWRMVQWARLTTCGHWNSWSKTNFEHDTPLLFETLFNVKVSQKWNKEMFF